jgi:hypothetical protein
MVNFTPLFTGKKRPWYPLDRRIGGLQSGSGFCGKEKFLPLLRIEPLL